MTRRMDGVAGRLGRAGVTEREAEVLLAVAERLRNREIAGRLHVSVRTVESHVAALLRKLGVADRAALAEMGAEFGRTASADPLLPVPLTSLIGRQGETRQLISLVDAHRLVTLTGAGGVGKTRLALHVATVHADPFPDGVRLADLAPVTPDMVGDMLARALGVIPQPGSSLRDILREVAGEARCLPHLAALAILLAGDAGQGPDNRALAQLTGPACTAVMIDRLRAEGTVLTYDPDEKTVRAGDHDAPAVVIAEDRQHRTCERRTA